jgi:AcrR family transcriptional regulator
MPRPFTDHEKELIRKRLLQHGYKLFSAHGLAKTNVEELARAAGISKGAFYGFYESKEALFMDIIEQVELRMRQEVLAAIDLPGPTPRARLLAALKKTFALFDEMPILRVFTGTDYELLFGRIPADKLHEHLGADRVFIDELITRCRAAGIPVVIAPEQLTGLLYPLVLAILHNEDFGPQAFLGSIDLLLELIAAYCLGEVRPEKPAARRIARKELKHDLAHRN